MERVLPRITAPTLIVQGEQDTLFTLDQADANFRGLPGHDPGRDGLGGGRARRGHRSGALLPQLQSWFDRYLKHDQAVAPVPATFRAAVPATALVGRDEGQGEPTTDHRRRLPRSAQRRGRAGATRPLDGETQQVVSPPGGVPTAMTSLPGSSSEAAGAAAAAAAYQLAVLPGQSAIFTTDDADRAGRPCSAAVGSGWR